MIQVVFSIRSHYDKGTTDLSRYITSVSRNKSLSGSTTGTWTITLKIPHGDSLDIRLKQVVRDDDWVTLTIVNNENKSTWFGIVDGLTCRTSVESNGVEVRWWTINGSDWSRCLSVGQVRLSALFSTFAQQVRWDTSGGIAAVAVADTLVNPMALPANLARVIGDIAATIDKNAKEKAASELALIPGIIDIPRWHKVISEAVNWNEHSEVPLAHLVIEMLRGQWVDASGEPLVFKIDFKRFGPVKGVPWRLNQIVGQRMITCDQLLRQFSNIPYTELYYDNTDNAELPCAIVYRDAPYGETEMTPEGVTWLKLAGSAIVISSNNVMGYTLSRDGAERYTFWRPIATTGTMAGYDVLLDTEKGKLPLIDKSDVPRHGIRVIEPEDNYFPPGARLDETVTEYYRHRMQVFREWHKNRPEYLSGQVQLKQIDPRIKVGTVVSLPISWSFRDASSSEFRTIDAAAVYGYVVGVTDNIVVDQRTGVTKSTTTLDVTTVRPYKMPVPAVESWRTGPKQAMIGTTEEVVSESPIVELQAALASSGFHYTDSGELDLLTAQAYEDALAADVTIDTELMSRVRRWTKQRYIPKWADRKTYYGLRDDMWQEDPPPPGNCQFIPAGMTWQNDNITYTRMATTPTVTVYGHKLALPILKMAFAEIETANRPTVIWRPSVIQGFNLRTINWTTGKPLSMHGYGAAIDVDPSSNSRGSSGVIPGSVVAIAESWGINWGGRWKGNDQDPMHFQTVDQGAA